MTEPVVETSYQTVAAPVRGSERFVFVDILRGFAIFGILVVNMYAFSGTLLSPQTETDRLDKAVAILVILLFQAKFYSLFSLLFGWGMSFQMFRAIDKGVAFVPLYVRRMAILFLFGIIHGIFLWTGDILTSYAVLGVLLLLFRNRSEKTLLIAMVLSLLLPIVMVIPGSFMDGVRDGYAQLTEFMRLPENQPQSIYAYGNYSEITQRRLVEFISGQSWFIYWVGNVFAMFLLGLYLGKRRIFQEVTHYSSLIRQVLWFGLFVGLLFNGLSVWVTVNPGAVPAQYDRFIRVSTRTIGAPALMLFYVSAIILLLRRESWQVRLAPLAPVGRMALTNYLIQTIVVTLIFYSYGLGLYGEITPTACLILTGIVFLGQIRFSSWWMARYRFGPMEWLWRTLTYGRLQPFRRGEASASKSSRGLQSGPRLVKPSPLLLLTAAWLVLLLWGAALLAWNGNLAARQSIDPLISSANPALISDTGNRTEGQVSTDDNQATKQAGLGAESQLRATPVVDAVAYNPGPIAALGDTAALAATFNLDEALAQIEELAGPEYQGRLAGSSGGRAAGEYIAAEFAHYRLRPAGDDGTYFQTFPITYTRLTAVPDLAVIAPDGSREAYGIFHDYSPLVGAYMGAGQASAGVYWVNHCQPEDFSGLDVAGKIVFCHAPDDSQDLIAAGRNALEYGAEGLLLLTDAGTRPPDFGSRYSETWVPETIPAARVFEPLAKDLLAGSGLTSADLDDELSPFPLRTRVEFTVETSAVERHLARNVLGVLPGRDPDYAGEVVIIGAHYDHLGQGPDGTLWSGANDNASGVATLLEIAGSWDEQGYVPRRTVVFAAWDAEEWGLIGSEFYVRHPRYPLEETVAAIQVDMVGAGVDTLSISGDRELSAQLLSAASAEGVEANITNLGRSDHVPFLQAGVPSSLLIWLSEAERIDHYHRPADLPAVIEEEKLAAAANIASVTLLDLAESEPAIESLLARRRIAAEEMDVGTFLRTSSPEQVDLDRTWLSDLMSLAPTGLELTLDNLHIMNDTASGTVNIHLTLPGETGVSSAGFLADKLSVLFKHGDSGWQWAGPNLTWVRSEDIQNHAGRQASFSIAYPPDEEVDVSSLAAVAASQYEMIAHKLGLPVETESSLILMPDSEAIRVSTAMSLPPDQDVWVGPGTVKIVYSQAISQSQQLPDALAQLVLANAGVTQEAAPWLWEGLPLVLQEEQDREATQRRTLPALNVELRSPDVDRSPALSWAAVSYIRDQLGFDGLGQFIAGLGRACRQGGCQGPDGLNGALRARLGLEAPGFETAWHEHWRTRLDEVQAGLDALLAARVEAALAGDKAAFLATVDPEQHGLLSAQEYWFSDLSRQPFYALTLEAQPRTLFEDGRVLAEVVQSYRLIASEAARPEQIVLQSVQFSPRQDGYLWAGVSLQELTDGRVTVRYPGGEYELARQLLDEAGAMYRTLAAKLATTDPDPVIVELFPNHDSFRAAIALAFPEADWIRSWSGSGTAVKLWQQDGATAADYRPELAVQLARQLLYSLDVEAEWLLKGASLYLARPLEGGAYQAEIAAALPEIYQAAQEDSAVDLTAMAADESLSRSAAGLARAQAWDSIRYLVETEGWPTLLSLLRRQAGSENVEEAVEETLGISLAEFTGRWASSLARGHVQEGWFDLLAAFDGDRALQSMNRLAGPEMAGRQAGTAGAEIAAAYIAEQFAALGLQPAGGDRSSLFMQTLPFTLTTREVEPSLTINGDAQPYAYRHEFLSLRSTIDDGRPVGGELVWVGNDPPPDTDLNGQIMVAMAEDEVEDLINQALEFGAEGLILVGTKKEVDELFAKQPLVDAAVIEIPVIELTLDGTLRFLERIGESYDGLNKLGPVWPLGISGQVNSPVSEQQPAQTANVLGLLPGSDPILAKEVIVIGAHYDHVGDDPESAACEGGSQATCIPQEGVRYSGANDNASGVATILEIARAWLDEGYRPKRSVLFAAWGGQELNQLGSTYFIQTPTVPLTNVIAMVALDGVGGGDGFSPGVQGDENRDMLLLHSTQVAAGLLEQDVVETEKKAISDHLAFDSAGLPSILISWRLANENNLPDELANGVNPERLTATGRLAALTLMILAQ